MDKLTAMRVFVEVASSESFSACADRLDMSRAMVTRYVHELEKWLGARLLQRTTRRISLTQTGEQCLRHCQQMLELASSMEEDASENHRDLRGQLRLTCSMAFAQAWLYDAVHVFVTQHPGIKIDLNAGDGALNLVESRIDLAIRISNHPDPTLVARPLATCESVLVASQEYLEQHGVPQHPQELAQHRCLSHTYFGKETWVLTCGDQTLETRVPVALTANETTVLLRYVQAGAGIAMLPTFLLNSLQRQHNVRQVLPHWKPISMDIYALYPSRRQLPKAVRALLDHLVQYFQPAPWKVAPNDEFPLFK